jgi:RNA-directed DNA polymerase
MRAMMTKLKLTVNDSKTRVAKLPEERFDFLGYTFGRFYSTKTGRAYFGTVPAKSRVVRICDAISKDTGHDSIQLDPEIVVRKLNQRMNGWANRTLSANPAFFLPEECGQLLS